MGLEVSLSSRLEWAVRAGELRLDSALVALMSLKVVGFGVGFTTALAAMTP
jgi:hypothetical protein